MPHSIIATETAEEQITCLPPQHTYLMRPNSISRKEIEIHSTCIISEAESLAPSCWGIDPPLLYWGGKSSRFLLPEGIIKKSWNYGRVKTECIHYLRILQVLRFIWHQYLGVLSILRKDVYKDTLSHACMDMYMNKHTYISNCIT